MTPERWRDVERVCQGALDRPPEERTAFIERECAGDAELRGEVESLMRQQADAEEVLEKPLWDAAVEAFGDGEADQAPRFRPGDALGPFEIVSLLGVGGMGEVYRARDVRLGRTVALKMLPPDAWFAPDPSTPDVPKDRREHGAGATSPGSPHAKSSDDRRYRLELEARAVSSLAHPHICALFDFRSDEGVDYLVMEYLEGETLAHRMARATGHASSTPAGLPPHEALEYGAQIAEALAAAHRQGIVHRDLKPGNVMLTRDGVKLLDFGLAKVKAPVAALAVAPAQARAPRTAAGVILGTVHYMAPEQLQGQEADARSDLFAFGALLCEMLTGRRAFGGSSPASVIAAILEREPAVPPDWQPLMPGLDRLVRGCLAKDPAQRWDSASLAAKELRRIAADVARGDARRANDHVESGQGPRTRGPGHARRWRWLAAGALAVVAALGAVAGWQAKQAAPLAPLERLDLDLGAGFRVHPRTAKAVLSPDGQRLAFRAGVSLFIRDLGQSRPRRRDSGSGVPGHPFFSPDGQWLAFFANGKLRKVNIAGGSVLDICEASTDTSRGASWGDDNFIVAAFEPTSGLSRVPASGGAREVLTTLEEARRDVTHRWPQVLPGSELVIFTSHTIAGRYDDAAIEVVSVRSRQRKVLHQGGYFGRYLPSGHLVFVRHNTLFAAPLDLSRLELTAPPVPVIDDVIGDDDLGRLEFSFSSRGDALTLTGEWQPPPSIPAWRDRSGRIERLPMPAHPYADPRLSPDGRRIVATVPQGALRQMLVHERETGETFRLVSQNMDLSPIWAPDGQHVVFASDAGLGMPNLYWRRADGAGEICRLTRSPTLHVASSMTADGRLIAFMEQHQVTGTDIWLLRLDLSNPDRPVPLEARPLLATPDEDHAPALSPDGRWLAYASDASGSDQVYVRSLTPGGELGGQGDMWQVSREGGDDPVWSRNGRRLFFRAPGQQVMVAELPARAAMAQLDTPRRWAEWVLPGTDGRIEIRSFDVAADGDRVLTLDPLPAEPSRPPGAVTFLGNFFDELRRRAPVR